MIHEIVSHIPEISREKTLEDSRLKARKEAENMPEKIDGTEEIDRYPDRLYDIPEDVETSLEAEREAYLDDLKARSECPETLPDDPFEVSDLEKVSPEELEAKREEFARKKDELKRQWEEKHGRPWPKYEHDVYSENGKLIRKAGQDYDAHHIQPLGMGGKNEVDNITPLHAEEHYDKQGIHAPGSPYDRLNQELGGSANG